MSDTEEMDVQVYNYPPSEDAGDMKFLLLGPLSSLNHFLIELDPANGMVNVTVDVGVEDEQVPEVLRDVVNMIEQIIDSFGEDQS